MTNDRGKALDALIFKGRLHRLNAREFMLAQMFFASAGGSAGTDTTVTGSLPLTLASALAKPLLSLTREGKVEQRNLPQGYTEVEYLQTDGNSYIDTGVLLSNTDAFEITFQSPNTLNAPIMGAISGGASYESTNNLCVTYTIVNNLSAYAVYCDGAAGNANYSWNGGNRADGLKHTVKYNGLNIAPTLDGVAMTQLTSHTLTANTPTVTTWLFGRNNTSTGALAQSGVRIFDVNIQGKGHFIPAKRNSDNAVGMYDLVSGAFLTNAGTGAFTAGAEVTPTPDRPIDLWCNNGVLKVRQNLWDGTTGEDGYLNTSGAVARDAAGYITSDYIPIKASTDYSFYIKYTTRVVDRGFRICFYTDAKAFIGPRQGDSTPDIAEYVFNITSYADAAYMRISNKVSGTAETICVEGTYAVGTIHNLTYVDGTPEVLTVIGQNLVDLDAVTNGYYYTTGGTYSVSTDCRLTDYIPVKAGEKYTVWAQADALQSNANVRANLFDGSQTWLSQPSVVLNSLEQPKVLVVTPAVDGYLRVSANYQSANRVDWSTLQIVQGEYTLETMPSYEPYVAPQTASVPDLLAVGDYKDTAEIIGGLKTGRIGVKVFTGNEVFINGQNGWITEDVQDQFWSNDSPYEPICTHFVGTSGTPVAGSNTVRVYRISDNTGRMYFGVDKTIEEFSTTTKFAAWFASEYAAGTPVIVIYPLATETTEQTTPQPLTTSKGTNVVDSVNNVPSVSATVVYKKR